MNSKQLSIILGVVAIILLAAVGYMALRDNSQTDTLTEQNTTPNGNLVGNNTNTVQPTTNTPTQPTNTTTSTDETANWNAYSGATLQLSLKYPQNWSVNTDGQNSQPIANVNFYPPNPKSMQQYLSIGKNTGPYALKNFDEVKEKYARLEQEPNANYKFSFQETTIGGEKALVVLRSDLPNYKEIYLFHNNAEYNINTGPHNINEINTILTTLKFTK